VAQWGISDQESSSDHNIIKYVIGQGDSNREIVDFQNVRYLFKKENYALFQENLVQSAKTKLCGLHIAEITKDLDIMLCERIAEEADIEKSIEEFQDILKTACYKTYKKRRTSKKTTQKSVQLCAEELTILRKRTNALRRIHQRTRNNDELRERRKVQCLEGKAQYTATIK
jgi:hypothetical protein